MNQQTPQVFLAPVNYTQQPQPQRHGRPRRNRNKKKDKDKGKSKWKTMELFLFLTVISPIVLPAASMLVAMELEIGKNMLVLTAESLIRTFGGK